MPGPLIALFVVWKRTEGTFVWAQQNSANDFTARPFPQPISVIPRYSPLLIPLSVPVNSEEHMLRS